MVFHPSWGTLNLFLYESGLLERYIPWLTNPQLARLSVTVAFVWTQFPFAAILLMAALTMIDRDLYDAARVDGAGIAQRFRYITFHTSRTRRHDPFRRPPTGGIRPPGPTPGENR